MLSICDRVSEELYSEIKLDEDNLESSRMFAWQECNEVSSKGIWCLNLQRDPRKQVPRVKSRQISILTCLSSKLLDVCK